MVKISSVYVVSTGSCTLRLVSHDVLVVFFTALSPSVYVVLSAVHLSGVPAVVGIPSCSSCLFSAVRPAVDVFLSMLLHPWSPSWLESLLCLPSLLLLRSLLSVVLVTFLAVPVLVCVPAVIGFLAVVASLEFLLFHTYGCKHPCCR